MSRMHRHWVDPTRPFAEYVAKPAHGVVVTSATLTDGSGDAGRRLGGGRGAHRRAPSRRARRCARACRRRSTTRRRPASSSSPTCARDDLAPGGRAPIARCSQASGGGALGLFTAIAGCAPCMQRIAAPLEAGGLPLFAQHVDGMDTATLVDIFRAEEDSCLLGTDAVRDGVDVPGRSLRLIVFDRVPWPRPDILHKARREAVRRRALRRQHRAAAAAPGVRPAHPPRRRSRRLRDARPA